MKHWQEKFDYLCRKYNYRCPIALEKGKGLILRPNVLHHKFHKPRKGRMLKVVMKKLRLFIDSLLNLVAVDNDWHLKNPSYRIITWHNALIYEDFLQRNPQCAAFMNNPEGT